MHQPTLVKVFAFFGLLLLVTTLSAASPTSGTADNATSQLLHQPAVHSKEERGNAVRQDDLYETQYDCPDKPNCIIKLPVCKTNYADSNMCTITYYPYKTWGFVRSPPFIYLVSLESS
jgi:hypothetical protein